MLGKSRIALFLQWFVVPDVRKVGSPKAASAEVAVQQKWHAAVARSTILSQSVQNTSNSEHFLKLRCRKMARRCGAKHLCKWKCPKHLRLGVIFELPMSKNGTPMWREAHLQLKMSKTPSSEQFLKFRSGKMARRCGAKHICTSKCTKHLRFGTLLGLSVWKRCPTEEVDRLIVNQSIYQ